jgi:hypothetical protein
VLRVEPDHGDGESGRSNGRGGAERQLTSRASAWSLIERQRDQGESEAVTDARTDQRPGWSPTPFIAAVGTLCAPPRATGDRLRQSGHAYALPQCWITSPPPALGDRQDLQADRASAWLRVLSFDLYAAHLPTRRPGASMLATNAQPLRPRRTDRVHDRWDRVGAKCQCGTTADEARGCRNRARRRERPTHLPHDSRLDRRLLRAR